jgi:hypothetical protein
MVFFGKDGFSFFGKKQNKETTKNEQASTAKKKNNDSQESKERNNSPPKKQKVNAPTHSEQLVAAQRQREDDAAPLFVNNQRVRYLFKATETWYDAVIVAVHLDDGPEKPYYTIAYTRHDVETDCDNESVVARRVEKQTTPDRLERVEFDAELTLANLMAKPARKH